MSVRLLQIALAAVLVAPIALASAQDLDPTRCHRLLLTSETTGWITSGVWARGGELAVVDAVWEELIQLDPAAGSLRRLSHLQGLPLEFPSQIRPKPDGFLLEDDKLEVIFELDSEINPTGRGIPVRREIKHPQHSVATLEAIFDWYPMGNGILGFGDLKLPHDDYETAFLYFDDTGMDAIFRARNYQDPDNQPYLTNSSYVAALGDVGYLLLLDEQISIGEVRLGVPGIRQLPEFPSDFAQRPRVESAKNLHGAYQATLAHRSRENAQTIAALMTWQDALFLLAKEAHSSLTGTTWWLIHVDSSTGRELSRSRLPTRAANLTVVPGRFWALIEKGAVQAFGQTKAPVMTTNSVVLVPDEWITGEGEARAVPSFPCQTRPISSD